MALSGVRRLASNTGALFFLQLANYVLPFVLIPYLTRVLGVSLYGVVALGLAIAQLACIVTDFGFNLSATHQIASNSNDKNYIRKVVGAVHLCKLILLLPVVAFVFLFVFLQSHKYGDYEIFFWLLLLPIIGQTFQPVWLFQGIERMGYVTLFLVLARSSYVVLVLLWVRSADDYLWVAVANGAAQALAAIVAIGLMLKLGYAPIWSGLAFMRETFRQSIEFFWSRAAVATYTAGGAFYLGVVSGPAAVAYYSAAEQLYKGAQALFQPLSQALYPYMTKTRNVALFFRILKGVIFLSFVGLVIGLFIGEWFLGLLFGSNFSQSYPVLVVFLFTLCLTMPSVLLGYPFLGALGDSHSANRSVMIAGVIQVFLLLFIYFMGWNSELVVVFSVMLVESFVLVYRSLKAHSLVKAMNV